MVKIISDSTSDLNAELKKRYNINVLPLHVVLGDKEYKDGVDITPEQIFTWADLNRLTPKTSAPSLDDAKELLLSVVGEEDEAICFTIAGGMSTSINVLKLAAEESGLADRVSVIDSQNLSTGIGLLVCEAAEMALNGKTREEIVIEIERLRPLVRASFVVDTLTYLHRGGRCSGLAALAGSALKLHPMISVKDGVMGAGKKYRGKLPKVIMEYVKDLGPELKKAKSGRVFITHSGCDKAIVDEVELYLSSLRHFAEIHETRAGGVISSHCGPGTLGVLFIAGE